VTLDPTVVAVIMGMAALTYLERIGGVWVAGRVAQPERVERWLRPVPGAILSSIVVPAAIAADWRGLVAVAVVFCVMSRSGNVLLAAALGTAVIAALRW